ncbi:MAG: tyrosine-type recombinase/integrase [Anaerolineales bacterium]|nr:tyrosine-type recombinase/integrase [Anaerolineales bacterium]
MIGVITPHSFRHYFVTSALTRHWKSADRGMETCGHKNIQVTQRYTHLSDEELDKAYYDVFENKNKLKK